MIDFITKLQSDSNNESAMSSITFNFNYINDKDNGYRIYLATNKCLENDWKNIMIVSAFGSINPRYKVTEIYPNLIKISEFLSIKMESLVIFLDLLAITGLMEKHFFEWKFNEVNGIISDTIEENILCYSECNAINDYNNITKRFFSNSSLNSKQIIDIMTFALREKCYDDISLEHMVKNFKLSLKKRQEENNISRELQVL